MDKCGNIALGYSVSAPSTTYPGIHATGRVSTDPPGQLQAETVLQPGSGSQTTFGNWGLHSTMNVDPVDDSTFWYTQEYIAATGNRNWHTRIVSMKMGTCP